MTNSVMHITDFLENKIRIEILKVMTKKFIEADSNSKYLYYIILFKEHTFG